MCSGEQERRRKLNPWDRFANRLAVGDLSGDGRSDIVLNGSIGNNTGPGNSRAGAAHVVFAETLERPEADVWQQRALAPDPGDWTWIVSSQAENRIKYY